MKFIKLKNSCPREFIVINGITVTKEPQEIELTESESKLLISSYPISILVKSESIKKIACLYSAIY